MAAPAASPSLAPPPRLAPPPPQLAPPSFAAVARAVAALDGARDLGDLHRRACAAACNELGFGRAIVARADGGSLVVLEVHDAGGEDPDLTRRALIGTRLAVDHDSAEADALRRRRAVVTAEGGAMAPVVVDARALGALIGEGTAGETVSDGGREALALLAAAFAHAAARAALAERLDLQRRHVTDMAVSTQAVLTELATLPLDPLSGEADTRPLLAGTIPLTASPGPLARAELSAREREVMELLAAGATNPAIAKRLCVSGDTVKTHVRRILRKLHAANRAEAVARYLRAR